MTDPWPREFSQRLRRFSEPQTGSGIAVSVKVRVVSGCFHREHSPHAYRLIDAALREPGLEPASVQCHEHESGPEILVWIPLATAGIALSAAVINLIVSILKARSDGIKAGDRPRDPLELIIRTSHAGEVVEEKVLRFNPDDAVHAAAIRTALDNAAHRVLPAPPSRKKKRGRHKAK
jgi:hypothetical protein